MKYEFNTYNLKSGSLSLGQLGDGGAPSSPAFIFEVITDNSGTSNDDQFTLPLRAAGTYDFNVDWGDGNDDDISAYDDAAATHTFTGGAGTYTVTMTGTMVGWTFNAGGDLLKIVDIQNWGDLSLGNEGGQFVLCSNLVITATDAPTVGTTLFNCFHTCSLITQIGATWDLTNCLSLNSMFRNCSVFDDPNIGSWDVSNVTDMQHVFRGCTVFDQAISDWDTSSATNMSNMFRDAVAYNQPMVNVGSKWDVSIVTAFGGMFNNAALFNQSVDSWDVSAAADFGSMFRATTAYNQSINSWTFKQTGTVTFNNMFNGATAYNQGMNSWDLTGIDSFSDMFLNATSFNGDISTWDFSVADTTALTGMLDGCTDFDQDLGGWNISTITAMSNLLRGSTMSTANYDATLIGWSDGDQLSNVTFHGGNATYTNSGAALAAHNNLDITRNWIITDGGPA